MAVLAWLQNPKERHCSQPSPLPLTLHLFTLFQDLISITEEEKAKHVHTHWHCSNQITNPPIHPSASILFRKLVFTSCFLFPLTSCCPSGLVFSNCFFCKSNTHFIVSQNPNTYEKTASVLLLLSLTWLLYHCKIQIGAWNGFRELQTYVNLQHPHQCALDTWPNSMPTHHVAQWYHACPCTVCKMSMLQILNLFVSPASDAQYHSLMWCSMTID